MVDCQGALQVEVGIRVLVEEPLQRQEERIVSEYMAQLEGSAKLLVEEERCSCKDNNSP